MRGESQLSKSILFSITLAALVALFAIVPALAQSAVPPTARQAATLPQYAARLAQPGTTHRSAPTLTTRTSKAGACSLHPGTPQRPVSSQPRHRGALPQDGIFYANGPSTGLCDIQGCTVDAYTINSGYTVTNSVGNGGTLTSASFAFWLYAGDIVTSLDWSAGTTPFGSDLGHGTGSGGNVTQQFISTKPVWLRNRRGYGHWAECFYGRGRLDNFGQCRGT